MYSIILALVTITLISNIFDKCNKKDKFGIVWNTVLTIGNILFILKYLGY